MCDGDGAHSGVPSSVAFEPTVSRRTVLAGAAVVAGTLALVARAPALAAAAGPASVDLGGVPVVPRSAWAFDLAPTGPIPPEPEVRYLLVHHSVEPGNGYGEGDVAGILRGFFRFHTTQRGWPDLAYNFMVDRFGRVWEGRAGSLAGPVAGDATGGNQGFDQLCCFIGNHQVAGPTPEAFTAMGRLLGALARRYGVVLGAEATTTFTSRGSNRHPAGASVTTSTIAGHRDMSRTQCPGDLVVARLPELRLAAAAAGAPAATEAATQAPSTTTTAPTTSTAPSTTSTTPTTPATPTTTSAPTTATSAAGGADGGAADDIAGMAALAGGAAVLAAAGAGGAWARGRRSPPPPR